MHGHVVRNLSVISAFTSEVKAWFKFASEMHRGNILTYCTNSLILWFLVIFLPLSFFSFSKLTWQFILLDHVFRDDLRYWGYSLVLTIVFFLYRYEWSSTLRRCQIWRLWWTSFINGGNILLKCKVKKETVNLFRKSVIKIKNHKNNKFTDIWKRKA